MDHVLAPAEPRTHKLRNGLIAGIIIAAAVVFAPVEYTITLTAPVGITVNQGLTVLAMPKSWSVDNLEYGAKASCEIRSRAWGGLVTWGYTHEDDGPNSTVTCSTWPFSY
ncbi:MAG TPA: hypothetical protein VGK18_15420 [Propionicimonas sp.]|jgi:hypothetical protein|uniref:hypothetical protein n=1 Tax=Propionicimonas sp. TaxID=1955623 RepID=UPI002F412B07